MPTARASGSDSRVLQASLVAILVVIVIVGAVVAGFYLAGGSDQHDDKAQLESASSAATSATSASATPSTSKGQTPGDRSTRPRRNTGPGDVGTEPAGLFCRDLYLRGYSYSAAVDYYRLHGNPNQMDADRDGVPCETVYPSSDVTAYWGDVPDGGGYYPPDVPQYDPGYAGLPGGLYCRDLYSRGVSYTDAVYYWYAEGSPDRMDADLNGIPCETVYPASDVAAYWGGGYDPGTGYAGLPAGLFCADLYSMGVSYSDAVYYWWDEGSPDRMDADLNGIPCETVYPADEVNAFWYG